MKSNCGVLLGLALGGLTLGFAPRPGAGEAGAPPAGNYARPFDPPTRPALVPLPPGAVEPSGWLRDWCLAARDGFTGHMDEVDDEFQRAWAPDHKMTGEGLFWYKGAWPCEGGGYPDLVVLAIGENVPALGSEDAKAQFKAGVMSILRCALARRHPLVVVRSCFWADAAKDQVLREACREAGGIFVDAGPLGSDASSAARSERAFAHEGVAGHPGDKGMEALAGAIVKAILTSETKKR